MRSVLADLRYGARVLRRHPGFTAVAVLTLALGIGGNTAIFSVVDAVLLRPLPLPAAERLVELFSTRHARPGSMANVSGPDLLEWQRQAISFERLAAHAERSANLAAGDGPVRVTARLASPGLFDLFGLRPILGRTFTPDEAAAGAEPVAVLSEPLWKLRFAGDREAIGRTVRLNGRPRTVVGVVPSSPFLEAEVWLPLPTAGLGRSNRFLRAVGLLAGGTSLAAARAELSALAAAQEREHPENEGIGATLLPMQQARGAGPRRALMPLLGAVGLVLLVACANVSNLLLARGLEREREVSIRAALGAGRGRLARQLLAESLLLALIGGALGGVLALGGVRALAVLLQRQIPAWAPVSPDLRALGFTAALSLGAGLLFGLLPALRTSRAGLDASLKGAGRPPGRRGGGRVHAALVVAEVALSMVLLMGAGLMIHSFLRAVGTDPGFRPERTLTMRVNAPPSRYGDAAGRLSLARRIRAGMRRVPGVEQVAAASNIPAGGSQVYRSIAREGEALPRSLDEARLTLFHAVSPGYHHALGIPLLRGRPFTERDGGAAPKVAIVNERLARDLWPGEDPIGRRVRLYDDEYFLREVVGVARDVKHIRLDRDRLPQIYVPLAQSPWSDLFFAVKLAAGAPPPVDGLRSAVAAADPTLPLYDVRSLEERLAGSLAPRRALTWLSAAFASVALLLAAVGLYGVISRAVGRRTREIGLRMALGARPGGIVRMVLVQGLRLTLLGLAVGLLASAALVPSLRSLLYDVPAADPWTFGGVSLLFLATAGAACAFPAWRALRVQPTVALRQE